MIHIRLKSRADYEATNENPVRKRRDCQDRENGEKAEQIIRGCQPLPLLFHLYCFILPKNMGERHRLGRARRGPDATGQHFDPVYYSDSSGGLRCSGTSIMLIKIGFKKDQRIPIL